MQSVAPKLEIRSLTGLRGVAAFYVMLYHFKIPDMGSGPFFDFIRHGYLCVDLFFVLSGYVMAKTYQKLFKDGFTWQSYKVFLGRRIARVYPLYLVITALSVIYFGTHRDNVPHGTDYTGLSIAANLLGVQAWGIAKSLVGPGWSISTEFMAYLLFPAIAALMLSRSHNMALISGLVALGLLIALAILPADVTHTIKVRGPLDITDGRHYGPLARCLLGFAVGVVAYRIPLSENMAAYLRPSWVSLVTAVTLLVLLVLRDTDALIIPLLPILILSLAEDTSWLARLLGSRPLHALGVLSYSLYLVHICTFWVQWRLVNLWNMTGLPHVATGTVLLQIGLSLVGAVITYNLIERPSRQWLRYWFEPNKRIAAEGSPNLAGP